MKSRSNTCAQAAFILCVVSVLGYPALRIGAQAAQANIPSNVGCTLAVSTHDWQLSGPAVVFIELRSGTGSAVDLTVSPTLNLVPKEGTQQTAGYWSPVDIVENRPLDTIIEERKDGAVSYKAKPLNLHLDKNGLATFKIDASKTKWEQQISAKWPARRFSEIVVPGDYVVGLDLGGESESSHCQKVEVHISARPAPIRSAR